MIRNESAIVKDKVQETYSLFQSPVNSWLKEKILTSLQSVDLEWVDSNENDNQPGIVSLHLDIQGRKVVVD